MTVRSLVEDHPPGGVKDVLGRAALVEISHGLGRRLAPILVDGREDLADRLVSLRGKLDRPKLIDLDGLGAFGTIAIERLPAHGLQQRQLARQIVAACAWM